MPTIDTADLVGIAEAEQITGYDRRSLRRFIADGRLPVAAKIPGRTGAYLLNRADVEAIVKDVAA